MEKSQYYKYNMLFFVLTYSRNCRKLATLKYLKNQNVCIKATKVAKYYDLILKS